MASKNFASIICQLPNGKKIGDTDWQLIVWVILISCVLTNLHEKFTNGIPIQRNIQCSLWSVHGKCQYNTDCWFSTKINQWQFLPWTLTLSYSYSFHYIALLWLTSQWANIFLKNFFNLYAKFPQNSDHLKITLFYFTSWSNYYLWKEKYCIVFVLVSPYLPYFCLLCAILKVFYCQSFFAT